MPESSLPSKMKLKPGRRAAIINAPGSYLNKFNPLPEGVQVYQELKGQFDWIQVFVKTKMS